VSMYVKMSKLHPLKFKAFYDNINNEISGK